MNESTNAPPREEIADDQCERLIRHAIATMGSAVAGKVQSLYGEHPLALHMLVQAGAAFAWAKTAPLEAPPLSAAPAQRCAQPSLSCPNMKAREGDTSMDYEHYECKVCGARDKLDYEEMR